jgi:hypothetical protein
MRLERHLVQAMKTHLAGGPPTVPEAGRLAWGWFLELSATRSWHGAGPNPISFAEIDAWARLMRWPVLPHHVQHVRALDEVWLQNFYSKRTRPQADVKLLPTRSEHAITPGLLDVMFG